MAPDERFLEPEIETMPHDEIDRQQAERVLELLPYAYERAGLYREVWDAAGVHPREITTMTDFHRRIPFITKDMIRDYRDRHGDPYGGLLCVDPADLQTISASSGTTGDPTLFLEQWDGVTLAPLVGTEYLRAYWHMGLRPGDKVLANAAGFRGTVENSFRAMGLVPILVDTWLGNWSEVVEVILAHRPAYTQLMGPQLPELERLSLKYDMRDVFSSFKAVGFAGEPLGLKMRERLRDQWGIELYVYASAGDTGLAWECRQRDGYHLHEDVLLPEFLEPGAREVARPGEVGELVSTSIDNPTAPLIRYRTDDLVRFSRTTCACGCTHARVWVLGRAGDETLVSGRVVVPTQIWAAIEREPETETALFQIIRPQRNVDELRLRVGYATDRTGDLPDLERRLKAAVVDAVGVEPVLELLPEEDLLARGSAAKVPRISRT